MWGLKDIHILRDDEISAMDAIANYINPESLDGSRTVLVVSRLVVKEIIKRKPNLKPLLTFIVVVLVDPMRPLITQFSDFSIDERLVIGAQLEAAVDGLDYSEIDEPRRKSLQNAKEITFVHEIRDNSLYHSNISIVPNLIN